MSYVIAAPEWMSAAAADLTNLGSTISGTTAAAQQSTTQLLAAGADEVSAVSRRCSPGTACSFKP